MSVVVLAWGNEARGDDGIGPALAAHVAARWPDVTLLTDDQLQLEHALDLKNRSLALFIDAIRVGPGPYRFYETAARAGLSHTSHALAPEALLDVCRRIGITAPPSFVLGVPGEIWDLGAPLSELARARIELATRLIDQLLGEADAEAWRRIAGYARAAGANT